MELTHSMKQDRTSELEIMKMLGEGSFGQVFSARHKATGAIVAVKVVPNQEDDEENEKMMGEIDILSKCNSPFIVGYFECFVCPPKKRREAGEMWIVMEFCEGGSVTDLIEAAGRISRRLKATKIANKGTSPEEVDIESPNSTSSSLTESSTAALVTAPAPTHGGVGRNYTLSSLLHKHQAGIIAFLNDIIGGTILGLIIILITLFLDYHDILHFQSAHHFRDASVRLLDNVETISNIEEVTDLRFMKWNKYESILKEINGTAEFLAFRREDLEKRTAEHESTIKKMNGDANTIVGNTTMTMAAEFESLKVKANSIWKLDKYCGKCQWKQGTSCDTRRDYIMTRYNLGPESAKIGAMQNSRCITPE